MVVYCELLLFILFVKRGGYVQSLLPSIPYAEIYFSQVSSFFFLNSDGQTSWYLQLAHFVVMDTSGRLWAPRPSFTGA